MCTLFFDSTGISAFIQPHLLSCFRRDPLMTPFSSNIFHWYPIKILIVHVTIHLPARDKASNFTIFAIVKWTMSKESAKNLEQDELVHNIKLCTKAEIQLSRPYIKLERYLDPSLSMTTINLIHTGGGGGGCVSIFRPVSCSELQNETSYNLETW